VPILIRLYVLLALFFFAEASAFARDVDSWPQGSGPLGSFRKSGTAPAEWSVVINRNIRWKRALPETGQSTVTVWGNRLFFTTNKEVQQNSELGTDIVAWCCDFETGKVLWQRPIAAKHPLRLSGCFSDSTGPPAVTDGERVCFFNASGRISCFDFEGDPLWSKEVMAVGRSQPFLSNDSVVFIRQKYMPDGKGHFTHEHKDAPLDMWTQLQALNLKTGEVTWTSRCGSNMGCIPVPHTLNNGRHVILVGRGGGHSPPEKPEGVSMIDAKDGSTIWTLPLPGFMSTMTLNIHGDSALIFHGGEHLWVDVATGKITRRIPFVEDVPVRVRKIDHYVTELRTTPAGKKKRMIIQQSNILVGDWHYFRHYTQPWLGRIHVPTGKVEYLQLPVQVLREPSQPERLLWRTADIPKEWLPERTGKNADKPLPITQWAFHPNDMKNSRGFTVVGDQRSRGNGWGHHAGAVPTAIGEHLYLPVMSGTVYVLKWNTGKLDENAVVSINDLGPVGKSWTRASLSFAGGRIFAHTIRELICIGK